MNNNLPIVKVLPELKEAMRSGRRAVLSAPPGTGKTTLTPQSFLDEPWLNGKRILMLEPRRAAARAAACRIAALLGEDAGQTVGWRIRGENRIGRNTRIEIVTEGILTRQLQSDPELSGVGMIIFDEFHERSLNADLGLALCLDIQEGLRDDLRLLVMSATLDVAATTAMLGNCRSIHAEGRVFPVETRWNSAPDLRDLPAAAARTVLKLLQEEPGSILVFLPGAGEINTAAGILHGRVMDDVIIAPLHGSLDRQAQDAALLPPPPGKRKVVLSTNIAETSLTIEGVRMVVDGGYAKTALFDPSTGMTALRTVHISKASAEQRRGRAGRMEPGICCRLWSEHDHLRLEDFSRPEIYEADLAPLCLELALWGTEANRLRWLDPPPEAALNASAELLRELGAIGHDRRITAAGRQLAALPVHPRLGSMLLHAGKLRLAALGCEIAALLEERDIAGNQSLAGTDLRTRLQMLRGDSDTAGTLSGTRRQVLTIRDQLLRILGEKYQPHDFDHAGLLTAFAYPDRIGKKRKTGSLNYLLSGGRGARFAEAESVASSEFIVAARLDSAGADAKIQLAAPVTEAELREHFTDMITAVDSMRFDRERQAAAIVRETRLGALVLNSAPLNNPLPELIAAAITEGIRETGLQVLPWSDETVSIRERVNFARKMAPDIWPDWSDETLLHSLDAWLKPFLAGIRSFDTLKKLDLKTVLNTALGYELSSRLEREFPERFTVPTGSRIHIDYSTDEPELPVRVQEMFGCAVHPAIGGGRIKLRVRLLSPAMRPIQITSDLPTFWHGSWELVKKEMKGRYPKHHWPDNPAEADPTRKAKPRSS